MSEPLNRSARFYTALTGLPDHSDICPWDALVARDAERYRVDSPSTDRVDTSTGEVTASTILPEPTVDTSTNVDIEPAVDMDLLSPVDKERERKREWIRRKRAALAAAKCSS